MATTAQRQHVKHLCDVFNAHKSQLLYPPGDVRTALEWHDWHLSEGQLDLVLTNHGSVMLDCSDSASFWFKCAGLWPFSNPGFTGTWVDWLGKYAYTNGKGALLAAPVVFGPGTGHHMGVVHEPDPVHGNPMIAGHGRPGFDIRPLFDIAAEQARMGHPGYRFLSIAHL